MTDYQRRRVYDAEQDWRRDLDLALDHGVDVIEVMGSRVCVPIERRFGALDHVQQYVDRVFALPEVVERYGRNQARVVIGRSTLHRRAYTRATTITLPHPHRDGRWAWRENVVLHEMAHVLTPDSHGPQFAGAMLFLFGLCIGPEAQFLLQVNFDTHQVQARQLVEAK